MILDDLVDQMADPEPYLAVLDSAKALDDLNFRKLMRELDKLYRARIDEDHPW